MVDFKDFQKLRWFYQVLIVGVICGGLLTGFWYYYLTPIQEEIKARNSDYITLQAQLAKTMKQAAIFEQFKKETEELQKQLDSLKKILPLEKETDQILRQAQQSASTSSLRILRVTPRPVIDHEIYTEWPIEMEVVGTYHNMGAFLDKIRQLPRIVNISTLRVHSRASEGDAAATGSVGATYTATTFVYREQAPVAPNTPAPAPAK
jgi:type IV pilus assembly protein PilO